MNYAGECTTEKKALMNASIRLYGVGCFTLAWAVQFVVLGQPWGLVKVAIWAASTLAVLLTGRWIARWVLR